MKQRIVTVGWNHKIIVYRDVRGAEDDPPKLWNNLHKDDILSVDHSGSSGLMATTSYDGQVCCWNIETGHVFCQMNVNDTARRSLGRGGKTGPIRIDWNERAMSRRATVDLKPDDINLHLSVDKVIFLQCRDPNKKTATLLVSVDGTIQAWSIQGGLLGQFDATGRRNDESVLALKSDSLNHILFTGDTSGYIKIWDISEYCTKKLGDNQQTRTPSPLDQFTKRKQSSSGSLAGMFRKKSAEDSPSSRSRGASICFDTICKPPETLLAFRGHAKSIVSIEYCEKKQLIVTASNDCYVRLWTINGKYLGTFGQKTPWDSLENMANIKKPRRLPNDIQRIASTQTLKVINGSAPRWKLAKNIFTIMHLGRSNTKETVKNDPTQQEIDDETAAMSRPHILDISLHQILGKNYQPKQRHRMPPVIKPKINHLQCVAFSSLPFKELELIEEPQMPHVLIQALAAKQQQNNRSSSPTEAQNQARKNILNSRKGTSPIRNFTMNRLLPAIALRK